jgi:hypothetical protein
VDAALLKSLFGPAPAWSRPCVVVVDAEASVRPAGQDSLLTGGAKTYAPRVTSGRIDADAVCFHSDVNALLVVQRVWTRTHDGQDKVQHTLIVVDAKHVAAVEFNGLGQLEMLRIPPPPVPDKMNYAPSTMVG